MPQFSGRSDVLWVRWICQNNGHKSYLLRDKRYEDDLLHCGNLCIKSYFSFKPCYVHWLFFADSQAKFPSFEQEYREAASSLDSYGVQFAKVSLQYFYYFYKLIIRYCLYSCLSVKGPVCVISLYLTVQLYQMVDELFHWEARVLFQNDGAQYIYIQVR